MEADPWEALDLDDSDLPSLLRPCKQRRSTTAARNPLTQPTSSLTPKENYREQLQQQPPPSASCHRRAIPGPAGLVQAAMLRKDIDRQNQSISNHQDGNCEGLNGNRCDDGVISTQDYIRRAMDDTSEFDDDFIRHPWISALQFLGTGNGLIPSMPISSIKKCVTGDKVDKVVAIIKSCTPNGLGGLMLLLKDPTGTVGASIHEKVISQSLFGKTLTIGAVLILKEVAVFSPVRSAHYLNITQRNLVKVFSQDSGTTSELYNSARPVQYTDPGYCGRPKTVEKMPTMQNATQEDSEKSQCSTRTPNSQNQSVTLGQSLLTESIGPNGIGSKHLGATKNGNFEESNINIEITKSGGDRERQQLTAKAPLPEWTDEQLDQLFAGDDEHDGALLF